MSSNLRRDDVDKFYDYGIHIPSRTLYLGTEVEDETAEQFLKGMYLLESIASDAITVLMNNIGGDEYHGLAIYDAIASSECPMTVIVYGQAQSMGSWILQAADDRVLAPHSTIMIHYGSWESTGTKDEVITSTKELERLNRMMEEMYLRRMKEVEPTMTAAKLKKMLANDCFLTAEQAIELGLADRILTPEAK